MFFSVHLYGTINNLFFDHDLCGRSLANVMSLIPSSSVPILLGLRMYPR
jgi:hypothetical protein